MKRFVFRSFCILGAVFAWSATCAADTADTMYGDYGYVAYVPGELPIVISVPHGGTMDGTEGDVDIPDHQGTTSNDFRNYTQILARNISNALCNLSGKRPHVIYNNLLRKKLDANRDGNIQKNRTFVDNSEAERAWHQYHDFIESAKSDAVTGYGRAFYIDLHASVYLVQRVQLGYGLDEALIFPEAWIEANAYALNRCTFKNLYEAEFGSDLSYFNDMLRGRVSGTGGHDISLGFFLENLGALCLPSPSLAMESFGLYFNGGYSVRRHCFDAVQQYNDRNTFDYPDCHWTNDFTDGVQVEVNSGIMIKYTLINGMQPDYDSMAVFARQLAKALIDFFEAHYGGID